MTRDDESDRLCSIISSTFVQLRFTLYQKHEAGQLISFQHTTATI